MIGGTPSDEESEYLTGARDTIFVIMEEAITNDLTYAEIGHVVLNIYAQMVGRGITPSRQSGVKQW